MKLLKNWFDSINSYIITYWLIPKILCQVCLLHSCVGIRNAVICLVEGWKFESAIHPSDLRPFYFFWMICDNILSSTKSYSYIHISRLIRNGRLKSPNIWINCKVTCSVHRAMNEVWSFFVYFFWGGRQSPYNPRLIGLYGGGRHR